MDRTKKGRETIRLLGMAKADLRGERDSLLLEIASKVVALEEASKQPSDLELQKKANEAREFLAIAVEPQSPFSAMAMDYLAGFPI